MFVKSPIRYAQSWEDHLVIENGLQIKKNDRIVTIISSGDNLLNLLCYEPALIYGYDINPAQIFELKLKITALDQFSYQDFITFLGYSGSGQQRIDLFNRLQGHLDSDTKAFWNQHKTILNRGLAFQGWMERSFSLVRKPIQFFLADEYHHYIKATLKKERQIIWEKKFDRTFLRTLTKMFINNRLMTSLIFQKRAIKNIPSTFDYQESFWRNMSHAFVDIGCANNPYLYWVFTGEILKDQRYWQPFLKEKNFEKLKQQTDKIRIIQQDLRVGLSNLESNSVDGFYISDIFDWMTLGEMEKTLLEIIRVAKKNAKIISFVLNYDKGMPQTLSKVLSINEQKSRELSAQERAGFYTKVNLFEINK